MNSMVSLLLVQFSDYTAQSTVFAKQLLIAYNKIEGYSGNFILACLYPLHFEGMNDIGHGAFLCCREAIGCGFFAEVSDGTSDFV